jgi:hypothetical protein
MLVTFRSKAAANIMMLKDLAERLLGILGRELRSEGIFTVEQIPFAIRQLERAIADEQVKLRADYQNPPEQPTEAEYPGLAQRAFPLLDMLRRAARTGEPVIWQTSVPVQSK